MNERSNFSLLWMPKKNNEMEQIDKQFLIAFICTIDILIKINYGHKINFIPSNSANDHLPEKYNLDTKGSQM